MNARKQVLVVLVALLVVCSGGAMATAAASGNGVDQSTDSSQDEYDSANADSTDESDTEREETDTATGLQEDNATPIEADDGENETDAQQGAYVTFNDQTTEGDTVVVENVSLASPGFVTIHDSSLLVGNVLESVIGTSEYLEAGTHDQVEVTLDEPLEEDETLIAMPHRDTNDNQQYDFVETDGQADGPFLTPNDEPVTDEAVVTVGAADDVEEEPVEEEPVEEDDNVTEEPVEEEPVEEDDNVTEEPVEEEPVEEDDNVTEEPVEEEPVEEDDNVTEEPVEEEPVEEEPDDEERVAMDGLTINVQIEQLNVFHVTQDELDDLEDGNASSIGDDLGDRAMSFDQVRMAISVGDIQINGADHVSDEQADDNGLGIEDDNETDTESETGGNGADESAEEAAGDVQVTIDEVTVFIVLEDAPDEEEGEEEPVDEEDNETEEVDEPVLEDPVDGDNETDDAEEDNETEEIDEPVLEDPVDGDNETDDAEEDNETEEIDEPVLEDPVDEDNETDDAEEDNETDGVEEDNETDDVEEEPVDDEDNETDVEEEQTESFDVSELDAPESAEVGDTITVTATVSNPSDQEQTETIQFRIDGDLAAAQTVTLEGEESDEIGFDVDTSGLEAGSFVHMILSDEAGEVAFLELTEDDDTDSEAAIGTLVS
ncbi:DUF7282 domain-containing protein [Natrinema salsiterrestre]|uniref:DUF7282 domain-containing protein n=1 Tax=Natrinema salsiterrestre TaxID=2950540 RepID=A0A9Q4L660_9EURY|nr:hypothetical protein [Natrinema salsiterrestre]MDF9746006.1 hypothetical protein [Natrinema salsiterrestre]